MVHWISGKTFAELILSVLKVLKKAIAHTGEHQKLSGKTFAFHRKSAKTSKLFCRSTFVVYSNNKQFNALLYLDTLANFSAEMCQ